MRYLAAAFWVLLCAAIASVFLSPGDWFGVLLVICLIPVGSVALWYIVDDRVPAGYSTRLTGWVRQSRWHAVLFLALMVAFIIHIMTGWPSQ